MEELQKFYQSILNIRQKDVYDIIKTITLEESKIIHQQTKDLTGYCKYIAFQIESRLKKENINTYWIELNDIVNVDHVVLIAEYMLNNKLKRILIDPTFSQFTKDDKHQLVRLKEWPSEKIDKNLLNNLLTDGITEINNNTFNNYLNSFGSINYEICLDNYLLKQKIGKIPKR